MKNTLLLVALLFLVLLRPVYCASDVTKAPPEKDDRIEFTLGSIKFSPGSAEGAVLFLFGAFCALWAQNTNRSAWLWFFLGVFLNFIAVLVLLFKNSNDKWNRDHRPKLNL
ncbi:MAG TPA: hypothetical protein VIM61_11690 [Chthoniobacterales bacterium]|jgi:hypothetical protein